jgi:8-oxo-dGTP pyrophosphatase MutT (NUDIX family)
MTGPSPRWPVSVKGVLLIGGHVVLLKNERAEWELPGGRLERDEDAEACLAREIAEELSLEVRVGPLLDCWRYRVLPGQEVLIVTYGCAPLAGGTPRLSHEHSAVRLFGAGDIEGLPMPEGYRASIRRWMGSPAAGLEEAFAPV